ncbi:protein phosphatase 1 regulatory subunit 14A isoform X2 [Rhinatrema bivittatum]|uniref:protein phosphatase 1 regulatory subunit 14A isoform X2 n=1 Tax=Rhinatrema bivittatum TaxID=194408 RepID=UPI00112D7F11|nr:protein phosphatase 1 regulatory subunit 14A isoform X2 [Rhinatrema bivittatum]
MAANKLGRKVLNKFHSPSRGNDSSNQGIQKRQARVTVKYDRKELQKRLDVEKWIDERLEELYKGKSMLSSCNDTEDFVKELILKLKGLQKQTLLKGNGLEHQEQRSREIKKHA